MIEAVSQLNQELIEEEIIRPEILDITKLEDIKRTVKVAVSGCPFGFCGRGIYGVGGTPQAYTRKENGKLSILELKPERNFSIDPPVVGPSWQMMEELVDWTNHEPYRSFIESLYFSLPIHLILPIKEKYIPKLLPFAKRDIYGNPTYAFMCTGVSKTLQNLIGEFESQTNKVLLMTSANRSGEASYTKPEQVVQTFPEIPLILADNRPEITSRADEMCSFSIYDMTRLPNEISPLRLGCVAHSLVVQAVLDSDIMPAEFEFDQLDKILTDKPLIA